MIEDYRNLVFDIEIQILNHALAGITEANEVISYKFQRPELKPILDEIIDGHKKGYTKIGESLWGKYPIVYGRLVAHRHSSISSLLAVATASKARIYTYNKLVEYAGDVATDSRPLKGTLLRVIKDMKMVWGAL